MVWRVYVDNAVEMRMECSFYFEIVAPEGINNIELSLEESGLGFYVYFSAYIKKNILKSHSKSLFELAMDTGDTETMYGSGVIEADFSKSKEMISQLSNIFKKAGYCHRIGVDNPIG